MADLRVLGIDNVLFAVGDLAAALRFYAEELGLPLKFKVPEAGIALFALGDEEPGLLVRAQDAPPSPPFASPRVWLEVTDARDLAVSFARRGVRSLAEPFEVFTGWTVEVSDPWGNVIGFTDYTKAPGRARRRS